MRNREMMTISLSPDTKKRLKAYAEQTRRSVSQAITDWIWAQPVKEDDSGAKEGGNDD